MENRPLLPYPDSGDSSPRSRETDIENPTPSWEEKPHSATLLPNQKVKFMVSYKGKIQPRYHDNTLSYVGGDTKILTVERSVKFPALRAKIISLASLPDSTEFAFKYQLPGEDLDNLISVTNDDDLEHLMHEYDRIFKVAQPKPPRLRLFLFPHQYPSRTGCSSLESDPETVFAGGEPDPRFLSQNAVPVHADVDFLFGLDNAPVQRETELVQELKWMAISGQEFQQQSAVYAPENYENSGYPHRQTPSPTNIPSSRANPQYWQQIEQSPPQVQQQPPVYMMHAPQGSVYHAPVISPANQCYYQVQQMASDQVYGMRPVYSMPATVPAVSAAAGENPVYAHVAYDSVTGRPVYFAPPPQPYSGGTGAAAVAVPSSGEGKVVQNNNVTPASGDAGV